MGKRVPGNKELDSFSQTQFGAHLRMARENAGLSTQQVAEHIGVARQTIYNYELGRRVPSNAMLVAMAKMYDVSAEFLLYYDDMFPALKDDEFTTSYVDPKILGFIGNVPVLYKTQVWGVLDEKFRVVRLASGKTIPFEQIREKELRTFILLGKPFTAAQIKRMCGKQVEVWVANYPQINGIYTLGKETATNSNGNVVFLSAYGVQWMAFPVKDMEYEEN